MDQKNSRVRPVSRSGSERGRGPKGAESGPVIAASVAANYEVEWLLTSPTLLAELLPFRQRDGIFFSRQSRERTTATRKVGKGLENLWDVHAYQR